MRMKVFITVIVVLGLFLCFAYQAVSQKEIYAYA